MSELRYQRVEGKFLVSQLADETVLMDTVSGDYMGLNPVGTVIWDLLQQPQTVATLVRLLLDRYEVTEEQCRNEVEPFLQELDKRKMLTLA
jgi:Coenzyme PQQ synthesis protein D (PqqD)